jgi:hypothetical protein
LPVYTATQYSSYFHILNVFCTVHLICVSYNIKI